MNQVNPVDEETNAVVLQGRTIRNLVYTVRGQQVMLDADLALLYQVETKVFNQAIARNIERFPEDFRFQLTKEDIEYLNLDIGLSEKRGGRRYLPYVFTEQGIAMLSSVLKNDIAVSVSIQIMKAFVEMRRFISANTVLLEKISSMELEQASFRKKTDERFEEVFRFIDDHAETSQKIFFDGQIYDAFSLLTKLIAKATENIVLIDGYVDVNTLNILSKKQSGVDVVCYTNEHTRLSNGDVSRFNEQYPTLTVKTTSAFHDRFMILDNVVAYHIGASLKDAGKRSFAISLLLDDRLVSDLLDRIKNL